LVYSTTAEKFTHLLSSTLVFAMASLSKVSIVSLRPELKVHFSHVLTGNPATFPLLSWHFVSIKTSSTERVVDPVLLFARDCSVFFVQVFNASFL
jgi:vacuolar protein sorting-associated protein 8